jgi:hypothetical protein
MSAVKFSRYRIFKQNVTCYHHDHDTKWIMWW